MLAFHSVFSAYGFWLPNDPRGSWSDFVRSWDLFLHGRATKVSDPRSHANISHDIAKRLKTKESLKYEPVHFTGVQAQVIAAGFREAVLESRYVVYACSILPEHVHLVIAEHAHEPSRIVGHLKARATQALVKRGLHPFANLKSGNGRFPSVWAHRAWNVFLDTPEQVASAVSYVQENPIKDGLPMQNYSFVTALRV
jgi:REP element-mobilizing transposase RayT